MPPLDPLRLNSDARRMLVGADDDVGADILDPFAVGDDDVGFVEGDGDDVGYVSGDEIGAMSMAQVRQLVANPKALMGRLNQARANQVAKMRAQQQRGMQQRINTVALTKDMPITFLGIDSTAVVAAGATAILTAIPTMPIRITNFTVAEAIAQLFLINSIQIGRLSLFLSAVGIPADRFLATSTKPPFEAPVVPASIAIQVSVTNISGAGVRFNGSFDVIDLSTQTR